MKKQGKDADALKAFKRAKELERQAEAREKEIRHQRRVSTGSLVGQHSKISPSKEDPGSPDAERSSLSRRKSELGENQKKRRTPSQDQATEKGSPSEKDDFLQELKALGWSEKEIREAEKKPAAKSEEQLLAELAAEVRPKSDRAATSAAPGCLNSFPYLDLPCGAHFHFVVRKGDYCSNSELGLSFPQHLGSPIHQSIFFGQCT